jgi:hypothetical protein
MLPDPFEQTTVLPALVAVPVPFTESPEMSAVEYPIVHCSASGCAPPEVARDRLKLAVPPAIPLDGAAEIAAVWASAAHPRRQIIKTP